MGIDSAETLANELERFIISWAGRNVSFCLVIETDDDIDLAFNVTPTGGYVKALLENLTRASKPDPDEED